MGRLELVATGRKAGECKLHVHVCGFPLRGSPFNLTVVPGDPVARTSTCTNLREANGVARAREMGTLNVSTADALGHRCEYGGARLTASITPSGPMFGEILAVHDHEDGTYSVTFVTAISARYQVMVRLDGDAIQGAPFAVDVPADEETGTFSRPPSVSRLARSDSAGSFGQLSSRIGFGSVASSPRGRRFVTPIYGEGVASGERTREALFGERTPAHLSPYV